MTEEQHRDREAQALALELGYERSRSVLEALREGVVVVDECGEIVMANPASRVAMSQQRGEVGEQLWDVLVPALAQPCREAHEALRVAPGRRREQPVMPVRYAGIVVDHGVFDVTAVPARSARTGQEFGTVFLFVDTSRVRDLQQIKDRFLSNVSHELRTPLTNIVAYAELLGELSPANGGEWQEFVGIVQQESRELTELVDRLFDYLQLESGDSSFVEESCDGAAIAAAVVDRMAAGAVARGIRIEVDVLGQPPAIAVDRDRMEQVVQHLLENAIKFSPGGGVVRTFVRERDGAFELRIEDGGPGVPSDDRNAVFESFHQLGDVLTEKSAGTGIGLATSRAIVGRFGGWIWIEDSPLGGASFVVLLPAMGQPPLQAFGGVTGF